MSQPQTVNLFAVNIDLSPEILPNFALTFGNSVEGESQLDYVLLDGFREPLDEFTICFWMSSEDRDNYGTPFSYATSNEDNEVRIP